MADDVDDFGYAMDNDVTGPHLVFAIKIQLLFSVGFFFFVIAYFLFV